MVGIAGARRLGRTDAQARYGGEAEHSDANRNGKGCEDSLASLNTHPRTHREAERARVCFMENASGFFCALKRQRRFGAVSVSGRNAHVGPVSCVESTMRPRPVELAGSARRHKV